ncbi:homoserine kinase [Acidianus sp. HS-5]|uniref:homoserine kinase n=1 Tax=Acidianus sp. HS-5 TaxID=2886040 RepID=UPI001EFF91DC|nr:homoserine kinase [Acidianus sp. HS-5]
MSAKAEAYSSSANLGPGFDILSMAHNAFKDIVIAKTIKEKGRIIIRSNNPKIPLDVEKNSAGLATKILLQEKGIDEGVEIEIKKGIPFGLGLGSSGASSVAAIAAINELFDLKLDEEEMVRYSMLGEQASSGSPHPDNVAASVYGGIVAVTSVSPVKVVKIPVNIDFKILLISPQGEREGKTKKAREILPNKVDLSLYVKNSRYLASLLLGFSKGDKYLIRQGLNDEIVEVAREPLYPHYRKIKEVAIQNDAIGSCVSGAGPTVLVLYDENTNVEEIKKKSLEICKEFTLTCDFTTAKLAGGVKGERLN